MPDFLVLCGVIPKVFGARIILDLHDPMPELMQTIFGAAPDARSVRMLRRVERWSIGLADAVVTVNRACAKLFASRSCSSDKITVVMNSPDETIFRKRDSSDGGAAATPRPFVVMYHGSLVERNGLAVAVDAFDKVRASIPTAELWVFGSRNAFLDRVMESVRARGLEDKVRYYGSKPLEQIVDAISNCDVGIIPNQRNIFTELNTPTRIFEYLALGKPVIAPNAPGITDYFSEKSLVFFELGDSDDLARKIEYVYRNPEHVSEITRRGQEVHFQHTWRAEKSQLTGLVSGLLNGHREPLTSTATARIED
jgi:glycosyltransferase involved in cell wall biosynthesis